MRCDGVGRPAGRGHRRNRALRADRRRVGERRLRRPAQLPRRLGRALARDGAHERLRRRAHDPCHAPRPEGDPGPPAADRLGRRAPLYPRLALFGDEARRARDGGVRAPGARRHRSPRDADRARHRRHAVLREPPARAAARRGGCRPRRRLRPLAAAARGRERESSCARPRSRSDGRRAAGPGTRFIRRTSSRPTGRARLPGAAPARVLHPRRRGRRRGLRPRRRGSGRRARAVLPRAAPRRAPRRRAPR